MSEADRRHGMDRLLRALLRTREDAGGTSCPDAEELAAFAEGALPRAEHRAILRHAAECGRCGAVLGSMGRSADTDETPAERGGWSTVFGRPLRWLVPVASVAAASLALYVVLRPPDVERTVTSAPAEVASDEIIGRPPATPGAADRSGRGAPTSAPAPTLEERDPRETASGRFTAGSEEQTAERLFPKERAIESRTKREEAARRKAAEGAEAARVAPRDEPAILAAPPADAPEARDSARAAQSRADAAAESGARGPAPAAHGATGGLANRLQVRSSDGAVIWRIGPGSVASRSVDGGRSWTPAPSLPGIPLAASAPSRSVCWVVGRDGFVAVAVEGGAWTVTAPPAATDLVSVAALDVGRAIAIARDGRRFRTEDGGATWTVVDAPE